MSTAAHFLVFFVLALAYLSALLLAGLMFKRAVLQVMDIFGQHSASSRSNAKSVEQLGLRQSNFLERIAGIKRDYKPQALRFLIQHRVVDITPDNRLYLTEEKREEFKSRMR
jgi:hypothetical protein